MAILKEREVVTFNLKNKEHRKEFLYFIKNNSWSQTAPKFDLEKPFLTVPDMIKFQLLSYYLTKEFKDE